MDIRVKRIIVNKLYEDLAEVELIPYRDSIWFINKKEKRWIFQYQKEGHLFWSRDFFQSFFRLFSLDWAIYEPVILEWAETILNYENFCDHFKIKNIDRSKINNNSENFKYKIESYHLRPGRSRVDEIISYDSK